MVYGAVWFGACDCLRDDGWMDWMGAAHTHYTPPVSKQTNAERTTNPCCLFRFSLSHSACVFHHYVARACMGRYPDGVYCGEFNGSAQRHGEGRLTNAGGDVVHAGRWEHDEPVRAPAPAPAPAPRPAPAPAPRPAPAPAPRPAPAPAPRPAPAPAPRPAPAPPAPRWDHIAGKLKHVHVLAYRRVQFQ